MELNTFISRLFEAAQAAGVAPAKIRKSLYAFAPVEHRLESVTDMSVLRHAS